MPIHQYVEEGRELRDLDRLRVGGNMTTSSPVLHQLCSRCVKTGSRGIIAVGCHHLIRYKQESLRERYR